MRHRISVNNDEDRRRLIEGSEKLKRIKQMRVERMNHSNTNITPNSNMSFMTINSNSSKNKLLSIVKAAKAGGNSQSIQAKLTEQASKLPISSNLLNKIK